VKAHRIEGSQHIREKKEYRFPDPKRNQEWQDKSHFRDHLYDTAEALGIKQ
jgi:hypothetical protein